MRKTDALKLTQQYINGWKANDLAQIIAPLAEDCTVIESHGPTYQGIVAIKRWFELWLAANSHIKKWDITAFYFCEQQQTAFCEWDFSCVSHNEEYSLLGISVIKFSDHKINYLHEYRMTQKPYSWNGEQLQSE
jgi:ketosteroid isomerase-like protein